ncbi:Polynucleotide 5'-hydroxyl-kinase grc3 [Tilletia horrida]|nr:Polynucleotide 5'-hydroxyl-kinase grc3 [Tilletia horrida]
MSSSASQIPLSAVAARKALREAQVREREAAKALEEEAKVRRKKQRLQRQLQQQSDAQEDADRDGSSAEPVTAQVEASTTAATLYQEGIDARAGFQASPLKKEKRKATDGALPPRAEQAEAHAQDPEEIATTPLFQPIWKGDRINVVKVGATASSPSTLLVALPTGHALPFRGIVEISVRYGAVVVQGAILTPLSPARTYLFGAARYPCPAPVAVLSEEGSTSSLPADLAQHFPHHDADCAVVQLSEAPSTLRTIEDLGRYFPLPGVEATFGLKAGSDLWSEAGLPSLPGFRFIGSGTASSTHTNASDIIEMNRSWECAIQHVFPAFMSHKADSPPTDQPNGTQSVPMRMMIRGPRGVGKSTFARTLLNAARTTARKICPAVAFLDLDIGQTEFGPPGIMSLTVFPTLHESRPRSNLLVGPAWGTPERPVRAHFLGDTSPKNIPSAYMEAASDLIRYYREHIADGSVLLTGEQPPNRQQSPSTSAAPEDSWQSRSRKRQRRDSSAHAAPPASVSDEAFVPLIINTQGWISGLGADLLAQIESILHPTHIFDFSVEEPNVQSLSDTEQPPLSMLSSSNPSVSPRIIQLQPTPSAVGPASFTKSRLNAADQRALMLLSYLHAQIIPNSIFSPLSENVEDSLPRWTLDKPLLSVAPIVVDITQGLEGGIHVLTLGAAVEEKLRLHALNGSIVAVVENGQEPAPQYTTETSVEADNMWTAALRKPVPRPNTSRCLGLGLVRSISKERHELHIVGPLLSLLADSRAGLDDHVTLAVVKGAIDLPVQGTLDLESLEYLRRPHLISGASTGRRAGPSYQDSNGQTESGVASGEDDEDEDMDVGPPEALPLSGLTTCGVPVENLPYLEWPSDEVVAVAGAKKRRVRRNLQRRAH